MATILDDLKLKYKEWKKTKDEENKAYKDALHAARMDALKKKAVTDAHEQVFVKKKKTDGNTSNQKFLNSFGLGSPTETSTPKIKNNPNTKKQDNSGYLSEEIFGPQKSRDIKDENNNANKYNWRF